MQIPEHSREYYDSLQAINWSRLKLIERSPAHYRAGYGGESDALRLGTAAHAAILEPEKFAADFIVYPGKTRRGKEWEKFEQEAIDAGKTVLSRSEHADAVAVRDAVNANATARKHLSGGRSEVTLVWDLGAWKCKGRADYVSQECIVDVKTTRDASPRGFASSCAKYGYYGQAAYYADGLLKATGKRLPFVFVVVESDAPWIVQSYRVSDEILAYGREQYLGLLGKLDYCERTGFWGGYCEAEEMPLELHQWRNAE